jgi:hypothetical protein
LKVQQPLLGRLDHRLQLRGRLLSVRQQIERLLFDAVLGLGGRVGLGERLFAVVEVLLARAEGVQLAAQRLPRKGR